MTNIKINPAIRCIAIALIVLLISLVFSCVKESNSSDTNIDSDSSNDSDTSQSDTDVDTDTDTNSDSTECETRGTWVFGSAISTEEKRTTLLDLVSAGNLNTIVVDAPPINGCSGYSDPDAFLALITAAKSHELDVYVWICNQRRISGNLEFTDEDERQAQVQWADDLLNEYGDHLDGIYLDYIRYWTVDFDINEDGRMDAVNAIVEDIYDLIQSDYPGKVLRAAVVGERPATEESYNNPPLWDQDVPQWFRDWYSDNPGSIYDGPTKVNVPMHMRYQQDPITWLSDFFIDSIEPMNKCIDDSDFQQTVEVLKDFNEYMGNDPSRVTVELGWMPPEPPSTCNGYDAPAVVRHIKYARSEGMNKFMIFILSNTYSDIDDYILLEALTVDSSDNDFDAPFKAFMEPCKK